MNILDKAKLVVKEAVGIYMALSYSRELEEAYSANTYPNYKRFEVEMHKWEDIEGCVAFVVDRMLSSTSVKQTRDAMHHGVKKSFNGSTNLIPTAHWAPMEHYVRELGDEYGLR